MTDRTVIHVIRHAEVYNPDGVLYGRLPGYGLSPRGRLMALRTAEALRDRDLAQIVSSPLERAVETADAVATLQGVGVTIDPDLIEASNVFEGQHVSIDNVFRKPRTWRYLTNPFQPSWGEPFHEVASRMRSAISQAHERAPGRESALVSHQLPIWIAVRDAEGRRLAHNPRARRCSLASVTSFRYVADELCGITYWEP